MDIKAASRGTAVVDERKHLDANMTDGLKDIMRALGKLNIAIVSHRRTLPSKSETVTQSSYHHHNALLGITERAMAVSPTRCSANESFLILDLIRSPAPSTIRS